RQREMALVTASEEKLEVGQRLPGEVVPEVVQGGRRVVNDHRDLRDLEDHVPTQLAIELVGDEGRQFSIVQRSRRFPALETTPLVLIELVVDEGIGNGHEESP